MNRGREDVETETQERRVWEAGSGHYGYRRLGALKIAAVAALREDRERLDWLEMQDAPSISQFGMDASWQINIGGLGAGRFVGVFLRAAIDSARAKERGGV